VQLCGESERLRSKAQRLGRDNDEGHQVCVVNIIHLRRLRDTGFRSAWSDLPWRWPDDTLDHLLVAVDARRRYA
jgi:hypothetical protein